MVAAKLSAGFLALSGALQLHPMPTLYADLGTSPCLVELFGVEWLVLESSNLFRCTWQPTRALSAYFPPLLLFRRNEAIDIIH